MIVFYSYGGMLVSMEQLIPVLETIGVFAVTFAILGAVCWLCRVFEKQIKRFFWNLFVVCVLGYLAFSIVGDPRIIFAIIAGRLLGTLLLSKDSY